mmetsp:Transcript_7182/g.14153  ORF Transcript_7182/g.14153 Transcript_7182/m.14153 type:complete len:246 (-) Transcript_7182:800-1537(-)
MGERGSDFQPNGNLSGTADVVGSIGINVYVNVYVYVKHHDQSPLHPGGTGPKPPIDHRGGQGTGSKPQNLRRKGRRETPGGFYEHRHARDLPRRLETRRRKMDRPERAGRGLRQRDLHLVVLHARSADPVRRGKPRRHRAVHGAGQVAPGRARLFSRALVARPDLRRGLVRRVSGAREPAVPLQLRLGLSQGGHHHGVLQSVGRLAPRRGAPGSLVDPKIRKLRIPVLKGTHRRDTPCGKIRESR